MSRQQRIDIDTVGYGSELGNFYDFYITNTFYLLAPDYYYQLYSTYFNRCLSVYDGWLQGWHDRNNGLVPQRLLQSVATGLNNMLFAHGIDFSGTRDDRIFALNWANRAKFYKTVKKAHKFAVAGGTSLLKLNRSNKELYASAHRIDTFFADIDANGRVTSVKVYLDIIHNTNPSTKQQEHYGICEERYFNADGMPCIQSAVYKASGTMQTSVQDRPSGNPRDMQRVEWAKLPRDVKDFIKANYPDIILDKEQYLPFNNSLGCVLLRFTDDIPQFPNTQFGQPIGDILFTENFQFDQLKYFEKNEVDLARARALVPEEYWNKDDPNYANNAMNERFYQKYSSINQDKDKIEKIQFELRSEGIRIMEENILKAIALKLNVSASSVASFLSEGAGARTATEIIEERTKSDTWIHGQINLNAPEIDELLALVMRYYNHQPVSIVMKSEDQSPQIERLKANSDVFAAGNMSAERFVKSTYGNTLSKEEQDQEIAYLEATREQNQMLMNATAQSWNK